MKNAMYREIRDGKNNLHNPFLEIFWRIVGAVRELGTHPFIFRNRTAVAPQLRYKFT